MPGSLTTPGRSSTRITRLPVLPSAMTTASAPGTSFPFAARWLAYALPYRRFAAALVHHLDGHDRDLPPDRAHVRGRSASGR